GRVSFSPGSDRIDQRKPLVPPLQIGKGPSHFDQQTFCPQKNPPDDRANHAGGAGRCGELLEATRPDSFRDRSGERPLALFLLPLAFVPRLDGKFPHIPLSFVPESTSCPEPRTL